MIKTTNIRAVKPGQYDIVWAIVRSMKSPSSFMLQVPALSPDWALFKTYRELAASGRWNQQAFQEIYRPRFVAQIQADPTAQKLLDRLAELDKAGANVALVCFCQDKNLCHRSLIAEMLRQRGCDIICE